MNFLLSAILVTSMVSSSLFCHAQLPSSKLESLLLYSALKYMEWPGNNFTEFKITILGNSELFTEISGIAKSRKVGDRSIVVNQISVISEIEDCHVLFLGSVTSGQLEKVLSKINQSQVVLITDKDGHIEKGSDLNFLLKEGKLTYQINETTLLKKGIKISSSFLSMAEKKI